MLMSTFMIKWFIFFPTYYIQFYEADMGDLRTYLKIASFCLTDYSKSFINCIYLTLKGH